MMLKKIINVKGKIKILTGLHIGAGKDTIEIGGLDNPIIKHPITKAPYIPGSSIKGKLRSLLETHIFSIKNEETKQFVNGDKDKNGRGLPCGCGKKGCLSCALFGTSSDKKEIDLGSTRLLVRDAYLTEKWQDEFNNNRLNMEIKYENSIDRVKGTAENPRPIERVPSGVEFNFNMSLKIYDGDEEEKLLNSISTGLYLIGLDAIGGCSSRGCGQVEFLDLKYDGKEIELKNYFNL